MNLKNLFFNSKKFSVKHNNYFSIYEKELSSYRTRKFNLLEIGILHGGSLHMWDEYFPNAKIFGQISIKNLMMPVRMILNNWRSKTKKILG